MIRPSAKERVDLVFCWHDLLLRAGARGDPLPWFLELSRRYGEPHRRHHTLRHIHYCFSAFWRVAHLTENPLAAGFAFFFHDAIYDVSRKDNEEMSARLFETFAKEIDLKSNVALPTARFIRASARIGPPHVDTDLDCALFLDIDMSILAAPPRVYDVYARNTRKEYLSIYTEAQYDFGRMEWITRTLDGGPIFQSPHFREMLEERAVANLIEERVQLQHKCFLA